MRFYEATIASYKSSADVNDHFLTAEYLTETLEGDHLLTLLAPVVRAITNKADITKLKQENVKFYTETGITPQLMLCFVNRQAQIDATFGLKWKAKLVDTAF